MNKFILLISIVIIPARRIPADPESTIKYYLSSTPVFEVLWNSIETGVIVGARNQILKLDENMTLFQQVSTGPAPDNINCPPAPAQCDHERTETNNDVKVLLFINPRIILSCGTLNQGMCHVFTNQTFNYPNISPIPIGFPDDTKSYVAGRGTVVSFLSTGPENITCLYSARSFDDRPDNLTDYTLSSKVIGQKMKHENFDKERNVFKFANSDEDSVTALKFTPEYRSGSHVQYIYGFSYGGHAYFLKTQRLHTDRFETRLGRVCLTDEAFFSYTEVILRCLKENAASYGLATAAYLGDISVQGARNMKDGDKVLYIVFGRAEHGEVPRDSQGSVLCMFPMSQIDSAFLNATRECFEGGPRTRRLESLLGSDTKCEKKTFSDEVLCGPGSNHYIEGQETVTGGVRASLKEVGTSLAVTRQHSYTVAFVGTRNGNVLKFSLKNNEKFSLLYTVSVIGKEEISGTNDVSLAIQRSNAFDTNHQNLFFLTNNKVVKFPVGSCSLYADCRSCVTYHDPLSCGWCEDRCSTKAECKGSFTDSSCPPFIYKVSPVTGHVNGGTELTIEGDSFSSPNNGDKPKLSVTVAGTNCEILSWRYTRILCRTNQEEGFSSGPVVVDVTDFSFTDNFDINGTATSQTNFTFLTPKLFRWSPWFGPKSGGTLVNLAGENLNIGFNQTISLAGVDCNIIQKNGTNIECISQRYEQGHTEEGARPSSGSVQVWIDGNVVAPEQVDSEIQEKFEFREDPFVIAVRPLVSSFSGGNKLIVTGRNLDSVADPRLLVTVTEIRTRKQYNLQKSCIHGVPKETRLICTTPSLVNTTMESMPTRQAPVPTHVAFLMDGAVQPRHFSFKNPQMSQLLYYPDPVFFAFPNNVSKVRMDLLQVVIKGRNLNLALQPEEVIVSVNGKMACYVKELSFDTLRCSLNHLGSTMVASLGIKNSYPVTVRAGNLHFYVGTIILVEPPGGLSSGVVVAIALTIALLLAIIFVILYRRGFFRRFLPKSQTSFRHNVVFRAGQRGSALPRNEYQDLPSCLRQSLNLANALPLVAVLNGPRVSEETMQLLKADNILFLREYLTLENEIGQGHFGRVYKGGLELPGKECTREVAVKTLHNCRYQDAESVESFLKEGLMMKDFHHHHVLTLIGVCFEDTGLPMVILPFMVHGDLRSYIQDESNEPTIKILMEFGIQIAEGMQYLSELKFVHRDLAARNCMLDDDMTVKVADFGLSRDVYEREYYSSDNKKSKLPVKWMAPESLEKGTYSTKSDVWAFGVVLWELMTRGVTPYPDVGNWEILNFIKTGRRMLQPSFCPDNLYRIMLRCWIEDPRKRPTFEELADETRTMIKRMENKNKKVGMNMTYANLPINPVEDDEPSHSSRTVSFI